MKLDDPNGVREEYATESRLAARKAAHRLGEGPDPREVTFEAIAEVEPRREHLRELKELLGVEGFRTTFDDEEAESLLLAHFARVDRRDAAGHLTFPGRDEA